MPERSARPCAPLVVYFSLLTSHCSLLTFPLSPYSNRKAGIAVECGDRGQGGEEAKGQKAKRPKVRIAMAIELACFLGVTEHSCSICTPALGRINYCSRRTSTRSHAVMAASKVGRYEYMASCSVQVCILPASALCGGAYRPLRQPRGKGKNSV